MNGYEYKNMLRKPLFYIIVHISTTTRCITTGRIWVWIFTSILSGIDKFIAMTELMSGSKGCFEFCDIEWFGEVSEESSFLTFVLCRLFG